MKMSFPILRFTPAAYQRWTTEQGFSHYNGEYPTQIEKNGRVYTCGDVTAAHVEYYPVLTGKEQLIDAEEYFLSVVEVMTRKGFNPSGNMSIAATKEEMRNLYATVHYGLEGSAQYLYLSGCFDYPDPDAMYRARATKTAYAENVKSEKELRLGKMLDMIQEVQELARDFDIPVDFINPLTLMADQLRTNILEYHAPTAEQSLYVVTMSDEDHGLFAVDL